MNYAVDTDLTLVPSEEAKICFSCPKKKCTPVSCNRIKPLKTPKRKERKNND